MGSRDEKDREFAKEMQDVIPLSESKRDRIPRSPPVQPPRPRPDPDALALATLEELTQGTLPFDIADTGEFVSGLAPGVDRRLLRRLRRGDFAIQRHLDLHGLRTSEAKLRVGHFLTEARRASFRCVLIVHGRGLRSKDHVPVLKEKLVTWLSHGGIGKQVLAFSTARPHDGGAGALYVLLRK